MKISIITAVYNGESSIAATLDSVAAQDHPDVEHIVIDGGSSDSTPDLVRLHGSRVACFVSEPDAGVYDAFNKGLRLATGQAIAFLNCGDTYTSAGVVSRMAAAISEAGIQAVFADVLMVDPRNPGRIVRRYSSRLFSRATMAYGLMPAHPSLFILSDLYRQVGEYDQNFKIAGDFELCIRLFVTAAARYRYVNAAVVRMPTGGLSTRGWRSKLTITREMYKACAMNGVRTTILKLCLRFPVKLLELNRAGRVE